MSDPSPAPTVLSEDRFARLRAIEWWQQEVLRQGRVLVVGAGALGNELLKNLALLGVGSLAVLDMDRVELSNLSRSVLFREADEGRPKAECAAHALRAIYPQLRVYPIVGNLMAELGLGWVRWAQVVVGALDNREARVFINAACARLGVPWIDGGLDVLQGIVRGFAPPQTACYECTMGAVDWELLNRRRSCTLLARRALQQSGAPTTPTTASIIGGLQAQEVVKLLHGMEALMGRGYQFDGLAHNSYLVSYPVNPGCERHDPPTPVESAPELTADAPLRSVCERAAQRLGGVDALDLGRELVESLECPACHERESILRPPERIAEPLLRCGKCGVERAPAFLHSIPAGSRLLDRSPRQIGLPAWDILWARRGDRTLGIELTGDRPVEAQL